MTPTRSQDFNMIQRVRFEIAETQILLTQCLCTKCHKRSKSKDNKEVNKNVEIRQVVVDKFV